MRALSRPAAPSVASRPVAALPGSARTLAQRYGPSLFLVGADVDVRRSSEQALSLAGLSVREFATAENALGAFDASPPSAVVMDVGLPYMDGLQFVEGLLRIDRDLPVIVTSGHADVAMVVQALRIGVCDFIERPFNVERLVHAAKLAIQRRSRAIAQIDCGNPPHDVSRSAPGLAMLGRSPAMQAVRRLVNLIAPTDVDVLITGETGSGKEIAARAIHERSRRRGRFVALNCAGLPESLIDSELFGHEAGAFTGALRRRIGKFEHAEDGTLFLDEIESMPLALQAKLLRVLQQREIERVGGNELTAINCRVIAAAKGDLRALADKGLFRDDLYYRLCVVNIDLPALRDRPDDVPLLMKHFIDEAALRHGAPPRDWSERDVQRWLAYEWPGNVRELRNAAERLGLGLPDGLPVRHAQPRSLSQRLEDSEREMIVQALRNAHGQAAKAADLLLTPKTTLYDKMSKHGLIAGDFVDAKIRS
jgi:two-component system C4-dicarboxylate transport response regulator DctD